MPMLYRAGRETRRRRLGFSDVPSEPFEFRHFSTLRRVVIVPVGEFRQQATSNWAEGVKKTRQCRRVNQAGAGRRPA